MRGDQLGLLLWKNYVIRKRRPGMLALVLLWPVLVFLILYAVRDNTDPEYNPTCQFPARLMPHNNFLPFVQNFICSLGNPCDPIPKYEEVPSYQSAKLGPLLHALQPMIDNDTILTVAKDLPKSIQFLRSMAQVLTQPGVKQIFERGVHLGDLFKDHDEIRHFLKRQVPEFSPALVDNIFNASIKMEYLVEAFGSSNMDSIICTPDGLKQFLILPTEEDLLTVSKALCALNSTLIPDLLQHLGEQLDFNGLFDMFNLVTAKFSNYDIFTDLKQTAASILGLKMVDLYVPEKLKINEWLPEIILLFKNVTFNEIDLTFIQKAVDVLDPIFDGDRNWPVARKGFLKLNSILEMVKAMIQNKSSDIVSPSSAFEIAQNVAEDWDKSFRSKKAENVGEIMDHAFEVLDGGVRLTKVFLRDYKNDIEVSAEVLDGLMNFFPNEIMNKLTYLVSLSNVIIQAAHHVATLHFESSLRVWNVTQNHTPLIRTLTMLDPLVYRTVVESFSRLDLVENFVDNKKFKHAGEIFCDEKMFNDIFDNFKDLKNDSQTINSLLCSEDGKQFLTELYDSFDFNNFESLVRNMLSTFVYGVLGQPMPIGNYNLTTVVRSIKQFSAYLETPRPSIEPDWQTLSPNTAWADAFKETIAQGRLDILAIHLSIAKRVGTNSISRGTIQPSLEKMDSLAAEIVENLQREPINWAQEVKEDMQTLIDAFYLTVADKPKVLSILEISNFTQAVCNASYSPQIINYPAGSNVTRLRNEICRLSRNVDVELNHNFGNREDTLKVEPGQAQFNWTTFNARVIKIYSHIDESIHFQYPDFDFAGRQKLQYEFGISWTKNITARDCWEVSIGLLCRFGKIIESPVFEFRNSSHWKIVRDYAKAISNVFDALQDRVTIVLDKNMTSTINLNLMPQTGILEEIVLRNIQDFLYDIGDLITFKLPDIPAIVEYRKTETQWPCLRDRSIGQVLDIRNGTREIVREIERIACNPGSFLNEWQQLFIGDINNRRNFSELFDWIEGYKKFRYLVANLTEISSETNILTGGSKVSANDIRNAFKNASAFIDGKFTDKSIWNEILTTFDNKLNNLMDGADYSSRSVDDIIVHRYHSDDNLAELSVQAKYAAHVIHKIATVTLSIIEKGGEIEALSLLGFTEKSPIKIAYTHLPGLAATIINGLSSSTIIEKISLATERSYDAAPCEDVFAWFAEFRQGISIEDYQKLKNCTCDSDPTNFNVISDLVLEETTIRTQPIKNYPLFAGRTVLKLYELGVAIKNATESRLKINLPFSTEYWDAFFGNLTQGLKQHRVVQPIVGLDAKSSFYIPLEFFTEILTHLTASLKTIEANKMQDEIHLWDLVEDGDVRQLLKYLESHATESIALAATLASFEQLKNPSFDEMKKEMCERHFRSGFWNETTKIHFLRTVCSFDPMQLLSSATSQKLSDFIRGISSKLEMESSLSKSLVETIEAAYNLSRSNPRIKFKTNIFDIATWKNLDNETWSIVYETERDWLHHYFDMLYMNETYPNSYDGYRPINYHVANRLITFDGFVQTLSMSLDLLSGGEIWTKIRNIYKTEPQVQALISVVEDLPNLMVSVVHTFYHSEFLSSTMKSLLAGEVSLCQVDKYLMQPKYMRNVEFFNKFSQSCQQLIGFDARKILPIIDIKYSNEKIVNQDKNEELMLIHMKRLKSLIIQTASEGFKDFRLPSYWISFVAGNFKDFVMEYESMPPRTLVNLTVSRVYDIVENTLRTRVPLDYCRSCYTDGKNLLHKLNEQLSRHESYVTLFCTFGKLDFNQMRELLFEKLKWVSTIDKMLQFESPDDPKSDTVDDFLMELKSTGELLVEIAFRYLDTNNENTMSCTTGQFKNASSIKPTTYIGLFRIALTMLYEHVTIVDSPTTHRKLSELGKMSEKSVPIWISLNETVKKSDVDEMSRFLRNASVNVNLLDTNKNLSETDWYEILISKKSKKFLRYSEIASNFPSLSEVAKRLAKSLDSELIEEKLRDWRYEASSKLYWLKEIIRHLEKISFEAGNLLDVASTIDFAEGMPGDSNLLENVVKLLREETIDKFFDGFNELLDDVEPFITNPVIKADLRTALGMLESMEIFKNLGLLNTKYAIKEMFPNWPVVRSYLINNVGLVDNVTISLSEGKVNMLSVFTKERKAISLKDTICSPKELGEILEFEDNEITIEEISKSLCALSNEQAQNISATLIKKLKFGPLFKDIMSASIKNILANANMNETEGETIVKNLGLAAEMVPVLKNAVGTVSDEFRAEFLTAGEIESPTNSPANKMNFEQFLSSTSQMLCGQPLIKDNSRFFNLISKIEENGEEFDEEELASLPNDFCRDTYKEISRINGGKIIWTYVKPLLRGRILYTPRTKVINEVMEEANSTFVNLENFGILINSLEQSMRSLANLTELGNSLTDLQHILASNLMKIAVKSLGGSSLGSSLENFDLGQLAWRMKNSTRLLETVQMLNNLMDCVSSDRIIGYSTEQELEEEASRLIKTNDFLAGIVFVDEKPGRSKRSYDQRLPNNITYKIRMDVDSVPSTSRLTDQFWKPGPDASFVENLRYLRGFVQLQDSIDRALIKIKTQTTQEWNTVTQQMPYPCWKFLSFQSALYESQGLQVCFFFALMLCVGASVRHIVWERESQNAMVMSVMGLKPWRNTFAWFITSIIELTVVAIAIHIILIAGKILPHSDPILVLFLLLDYVFASVTFCYMVSTMFSSASLAAVTTVVMFLLTYMPYIIVIAMEASVNLGVKLLICLNMSTSFCYGCLYAVRKEVQGTGLTWGSVWEESSPGDSMSLGLVLLTIAFDGCLYALIGYLVTRYTNSGKGFHGLRSISLWWADSRAFYGRPSYLAFENQVYFTNDVVVPSSSIHQESESDVSSLHLHEEKQIGVRFDDVRKVYQTETGECVAVDDFSVKLMEGEVTTLLGRNGAGKTTVIKMLTGMIAPTSGEIWLPNNNTDKPNIGVCPQTNVLYGCLTPREHMIFYAKLKNRRGGYDMDRDIDTMLTSMELNGQEDELVSNLSGGTQRRLCVCLAFLGAPNLVILDEPGAGVDPAARRRIWRLIDKHRVGRTVLLSTHHLDEADMLSDTVVIMNKGKILCSGSPLTLKLNYGQGYKVTVSFPMQEYRDGTDKENQGAPETLARELKMLTNIIEDVIPNVVVSDTSNTEVNMIIPFQKQNGDANDVGQAVKVLEDNQHNLGFSHFNLECDTLERVFLDMCTRADGGQAYVKPTSTESLNSVNSVGFAIPTDNVDLITHEPTMQPSPFRQGKALLKKRLWHFARDWRAPLAALILPTLFVAVAMGFSLIRPPSDDQPPLVLTTDLYNAHPVYFYSIDSKPDKLRTSVSLQIRERFGSPYRNPWKILPNDTGSCDCENGEQVCHNLPSPIEGLVETYPGPETLDWIVSTESQYIERRYGGWSLSHMPKKDNQTGVFVVWYNNKGHHSLPAYVNALNEAVLRAKGVFGHLTTINHPIKLSKDQLNRTSLLQHVADVGVALVLLIAFSLVGAQGAKELVRERLSEEKRVLYLAGVRPLTYWTTALIWDLLVFAVSILLAVIVFEIFGLPAYVARHNLSSVCLLLFLYAWAVIPFTHLAEKVFDDSSLSNMVLFCLNTFIGVSSLATILIIDILGKTPIAADVRNFLHQVLLILPQYALGDGLVQITTNDIKANLLERFYMNTYKHPLSWDLLGPHCLYLFLIGAILYTINLAVECRALPNFNKKKVIYQKTEEDEDVALERSRVENGLGNDVMKTINLRKEYRSVYGKNVAVRDLSFGLKTGECFGLFGVNGAGKSTTFKMLTTEVIPTAGRVVMNDREVGSGPLCSGDVGYCPQSDALDPFLTPHQSLTIHGEVSGIKNVPKAVELAMKRFDLTKYAHQRIANLSGGNKRKLSAAISVMVPSRVVLMDEATSGMDPASKDLVARAIKSIIRIQGSVLMTSHSVAECENLCTRVGVLARAGLRCIGSPQYLKHKYGEGYIVFLRFKNPTSLSNLLEAIARHFPGATIASRQDMATRILVPRRQDNKLSRVFTEVKDLADDLNAVEYTLTQSSLDQVLVNFSEEFDNDRFYENRRTNQSGLYSFADAIHMNTISHDSFRPLPTS